VDLSPLGRGLAEGVDLSLPGRDLSALGGDLLALGEGLSARAYRLRAVV
jgi:hypothetical protein